MRLPDGTERFLREWPVPAGTAERGTLLLVHGLGEHSGRYDHVGERLAALGLHVRGYDHRGHGESAGPRGSLPHPDALLDDLRAVFDDLAAARGGGMPRSCWATASAGRRRRARRRAAGSRHAGSCFLPGAARLAVAGGARADRGCAAGGARHRVPEPAADRQGLARSCGRGGLQGRRAQPRPDHAADVRLPRRRGDGRAADAARFTVPTLLLVAGADALVDPRGAREFSAALPAGVGTLHWYDGLYHELFNEREPDRSGVLADLDAWLEEQL